jgi:hypothetical protein
MRSAAQQPNGRPALGDRGAYSLPPTQAAPPVSASPDATPMTEVRRLRKNRQPLPPELRVVEATYQKSHSREGITVRPSPEEREAWAAAAAKSGHRGLAPYILSHARRSINGELANPLRERARSEELERLRLECARLEQENVALRQEGLDKDEWSRRILERLGTIQRVAGLEDP